MTNGIYLVGRGKVKDSRIDAAKQALGQVVAHVWTSNPGVVFYEHAIDAHAGTWTGIEKYGGNDALAAHLTDSEIGAGLEEFMAHLRFEGIVVIGDVDPENKERMAPFQPTYLGSSLGFSHDKCPVIAGRA